MDDPDWTNWTDVVKSLIGKFINRENELFKLLLKTECGRLRLVSKI